MDTNDASSRPQLGVKVLGPNDEPQNPAALVAVNFGDYRRQEVWVRSGVNIGNWYPLGGEFGIPPVVEDPRVARRPAGTIPLHPGWYDVLARGPVVLLSPGQGGVYASGWGAGRRRLLEQIEELRDDEDQPPTDHPHHSAI